MTGAFLCMHTDESVSKFLEVFMKELQSITKHSICCTCNAKKLNY